MATRKLDTVNKILTAYKNKTGKTRLSEQEKREVLAKPANQKKIADELRRYGQDTPAGRQLRKELEQQVKPKFRIEENTTGPVKTFFEMSAWLQSIEDLYGGKINTASGGPSSVDELRSTLQDKVLDARKKAAAASRSGKSDYSFANIRFIVDESGLFDPTLEFMAVTIG